MFCHYCRQPVQGRYVKALGAIWHPEHFFCANCGRSIDEEEFNVVEGKPYHPACYLASQAPRCAYCGKPISGQYTVHDGQSYHIECFRTQVVSRCVYCNKPLMGKYLVDSWGNKFCPEHEKQYPHCSFCARLIPPQQQIANWNAYGSQCCAVCRSTAIETIEQGKPLYGQLKRWISEQGLRFNQLPLRLEFCDRQKLLTLLRDRIESHPLGITLSSTRYQGGQEIDSSVDGVTILQGMPATLFAGVVIHELGHVWLIAQGIRSLPLWAEEGFCQLLSYRYYESLGTAEARYHANGIERATDQVYGEGFRRVHARSEQMGFENFIETLRTTRRFP